MLIPDISMVVVVCMCVPLLLFFSWCGIIYFWLALNLLYRPGRLQPHESLPLPLPPKRWGQRHTPACQAYQWIQSRRVRSDLGVHFGEEVGPRRQMG